MNLGSENHIAYFNEQYVNFQDIKISINDRGIAFGDGIYEAILLRDGRLVDADLHIARFHSSAKKTNLHTDAVAQFINNTPEIMLEVASKNNATSILFYLQITRGSFPVREHGTPAPVAPTLLVNPLPERKFTPKELAQGISCISLPDIRWQRRDIKTLNILGNVMQKQQAINAGHSDAILFDPITQIVTEGTSANVFIVKNKTLYTHPISNLILAGITRHRIIKLAKDLGITVIEETFTKQDLYTADEIFLTSSGYLCRPVSLIDEHTVGQSTEPIVGEITSKIKEAFSQYISSLPRENYPKQ